MFIKNADLKSSDYLELQYIKNNLFTDKELLKLKRIKHFKEDSIFVKSDDIDKFKENYLAIFNNPITPDNSNQFDPFGINLYTTDQLKENYNKLKQIEADAVLLNWLKVAVEKNYRIYVLGL